MPETISAPSRFHYGWVILIMATMTVFGALGLARFSYSVVLPAMQENLLLDNTETGMLATFNLVGYLIFSAVGGALATRYGSRKVIAVGLALSGVGLWMTGTVSGVGWGAVWCALTGIGSGVSNMSVMGLLSVWFASSKRGMAAGIAVTGTSYAMILVGTLVPELMEFFDQDGWRVCWFVLGVICLILALAALLLLRNHPAEKSVYPIGGNSIESPSHELPGKNSLELSRVYRSGKVWLLGGIYIAFGFSYIIYVTFFVLYLVNEGNYSQEDASGLYMLIGWVSIFCGVVWGSVSDQIGRGRAMFLVYLLQAASFGLFGLWQSPTGFIISALLFGITAWSIPAIMAAACGDVLEPRMTSAALGFITIFFGVGQSLGPLVAGLIADYMHSLSPVFLVASITAMAGAFGSLALEEKHRF